MTVVIPLDDPRPRAIAVWRWYFCCSLHRMFWCKCRWTRYMKASFNSVALMISSITCNLIVCNNVYWWYSASYRKSNQIKPRWKKQQDELKTYTAVNMIVQYCHGRPNDLVVKEKKQNNLSWESTEAPLGVYPNWRNVIFPNTLV